MNDTESTPLSVPCIQCASQIPPTAIKCAACGGFQRTWRKHLMVSESVLALLIAFFSVLAMAIPTIVGWLPEYASFEMVVTSTQYDSVNRQASVNVFVHNDGRGSGVLKKAAVLRYKPKAGLPPIEIWGATQTDDLYFAPGHSELVKFTFDIKGTTVDPERSLGDFSIDVEGLDAGGTFSRISQPVDFKK